MATLDVFVPDVEAQAPGCPVPRTIRAARTVLREFCTETESWRVEFMTSVIEGITLVDADLPIGTTIVTIHDAVLDGRRLTATNIKQLSYDMPDWQLKPGLPTRFMLDSGGEVRVAPLPNRSLIQKFYMDVSVRPSLTGQFVADAFLDRNYEVLLAGVLANVLSQRNTAWYDQAMADRYLAMYRTGFEEATARAQNDNVNRNLVTTYGGI